MRAKEDTLSKKLLIFIEKAGEPLETRKIEDAFSSETRVKILYRLNNLRGDGKIRGKQVGSGKGTWIWFIENNVHKNGVGRR